MTIPSRFASPAVLVIEEPTEYVDNTLQTASWWDKYMLQPGVYPFEFTLIDGRPVPNGGRPYYGKVRVEATLIEEYRVARLFAASSASTTTLNKVTTVTRGVYAYQLPGHDHQHGKVLTEFMGGRIYTVAEWDALCAEVEREATEEAAAMAEAWHEANVFYEVDEFDQPIYGTR